MAYAKLQEYIELEHDNLQQEAQSTFNKINEENGEANINYEEWTRFISYYRYYLDEFATDILKIKTLHPFQKVILRSMARSQYSCLIACRGLGKSWIVAVFFLCMAILYPNIKLGIVSGNGQQAKNVIIQKIQGELFNGDPTNETSKILETEIVDIKTGNDCVVKFANGSEIRAIALAQDRGGDGARSWRFNILLVDEARLVKDNIIEEILIPMTKTKRKNVIYWEDKLKKEGRLEELRRMDETGKVIFISSAHLKTSPLYARFKFHYDQMVEGNKRYMAICFPYQVGVQAGIFSQEDIEQERLKPTMSAEQFAYE